MFDHIVPEMSREKTTVMPSHICHLAETTFKAQSFSCSCRDLPKQFCTFDFWLVNSSYGHNSRSRTHTSLGNLLIHDLLLRLCRLLLTSDLTSTAAVANVRSCKYLKTSYTKLAQKPDAILVVVACKAGSAKQPTTMEAASVGQIEFATHVMAKLR